MRLKDYSRLLILFLIAIFSLNQSFSQVFTGANFNIPFTGTSGVASGTVNVSGVGTVANGADITVRVQFNHTFTGDLAMWIVAPGGQTLELCTRNGGANNNGDITFSDAGATNIASVTATTSTSIGGCPPGSFAYNGTYRPEGRVNVIPAFPTSPSNVPVAGTFTFANTFSGINANGTWTLHINDHVGGDQGATCIWSVDIVPQVAPCTPGAYQIFSNTTPVAIPTGPAVVTSNITVSNALPYLHDLNVLTNLTHTFAADLDITITSPAGTVVTLTTDNGAGNDDVFNGTLWDDDANPGGQVPYTTNDGIATDHAYINLTLASPLVPEEALAAFIGENPNGVWTITVSDDLPGDGGAIDWALQISGLPAPPITALTSVTNNTPVAIVDVGVVTSTVNVAGAGTQLLDLNLTTFITHTFAADLDVTITSPAGTVVTLTSDNGSGNDDVFNGTVWDDDANPGGQVPYTTNDGLATDHTYVNLTLASPLVPEEALGAFIGEDPNGTWTITISDDLPGDVGTLNSWTLDLTTSLCNPAPTCILTCPANITVNNDPNQCGAIVNYPAPTTTGACGTVTSTPASGSFFPVGTTTVTATSSVGGGTCSFTITVVDNQPPTVTCPANISVPNSTGLCGANVTFAGTLSDNCPGGTINYSPASGSFFPVGTTTVTATPVDAAGNVGTACTFTVTVTDTQNPSYGSPAPVPEILYYKFDGTGTTVPNQALAPPAGTATATLNGLTQGSTGKCGTALVGTGATNQNLNTGYAPNMSTPWTISFWLGPNQIDQNPSYLWGAINAGSFRCFYGGAAGPNNILVRGGSGDVLITGVNPTATFITVVYTGTNTIVYKNGGSPQTYAVTFSNVGAGPFLVGGYSTLASVNGRIDEFGMYSRALSAGEVLALFNDCPLSGTTCPSNITVNNTPGTCGATVTYTTPVAVDNCPGVTTVQTTGLASGSVFPVGTTTNTFLATDAAGNTATCSFTVTVNDNQPPTITCPANMTVTTPVGSCTAIVNYTVTSTDNCPGVTQTRIAGLASGSAFPLGVNTVTWRATDAAGNTSTCSFTITVLDGQLPVISAQPANRTACVGTNATFSVTASNVVSYQWQSFNSGTGTWNNIAGATSSTYTVNNVTTALNTQSYRVILTGLCTVVTSNHASLYVNTLPIVSISASPGSALLPGQTLTITSSTNPSGGSYAWFFNGSAIPNSNSPSLQNIGVNGIGTYRLVYTDPNGCITTTSDLAITGAPSDNMWVYPNPNVGNFVVRYYNSVSEPATVNVYDSKGAKVYQRRIVTGVPYSQIDIDLGARASSGAYLVELVNGSGKRIGAKWIAVTK